MRHQRLKTCGSTNDEARRAFTEGEATPLLISAEEQTAGRGRDGRSWFHLSGNFAGSFLIEATRALRQEPGLAALLSGLAIRDALISAGATPADLLVKWPNDVLLSGQKIAGVLAEMVEDEARRAFIIGIGVNLKKAPAETMFPAASAFRAGAPSPTAFGETLGEALLSWVARVEGKGGQAVLDAFLAHAWRIGEPLAVRQGAGAIEGIFTGLDPHGHMILTLPTGEQKIITAGDASRA